MTPYYEDDAVTIYHGDCREVLPQLADGCAELVATDPPYFRVVDAEWDDQWGPHQVKFLEWLGGIIEDCLRVLHERGTLAVFCSPDLSAGVELEMRKRSAVLNHIVWRKPGLGRLGKMDKESMRRFFPTSERIIISEKLRNPDGDLFRFRDHVNYSVGREVHAELITKLIALRDSVGMSNRDVDLLLGTNGMGGHYFGWSQWSLPTAEAWEKISAHAATRGVEFPSFASIRQEFDSRRREFDSRRREFDSRRREFELLSDVWTFESPAGNERNGHPTQKPQALMSHIIQTMSRKDDAVLDPFMGSGTTLRAAKDLGRKAIGIEIDERYCEIAAKRMAQEVLAL